MRRDDFPRIANGWIHDVAGGLWAAGLFVIWRLDHWRFTESDSPSTFVLARVAHEMFWIMLAALLAILVTGAIRLVYWRNASTADELRYRRRSLLVRHAVYLAIYVTGTIWAYMLQR